MRFLIDCTFISFNPSLNSGIQRVVRNIVTHAIDSDQGVECTPVFFKNNSVFKLRKMTPGAAESILVSTLNKLNLLVKQFGAKVVDLSGESEDFSLKVYNSLRVAAIHSAIFFTRLTRYICRHIRDFIACYFRGRPLKILNDDIIVLLDSTWQLDSHEPIRAAKSRGNIVVGVIYDLIPITHPHFFDDAPRTVYSQWFKWITETADGFMTISKTVCEKTKSMMKENLSAIEFEKKWFDYFYLGSELDQTDETEVCKRVSSVFDKFQSVYLMVSTIEPRKNHTYLLDAFDELWKHDQRIALVVIGAVGWKSESFLERIQHHPELDKRLFMFNGLSDTSLEYAYQHSKALVFTSKEEGFGLPIVEALQRGLPVMASDIPVFREIGEEYCAYFKLDDHQSLCRLITEFESKDEFPSAKPLVGYSWTTWKEATEQFIKKIAENIEK